MTRSRIAWIVASAVVVVVTLGLAAGMNDAWQNTERDFTHQPFDTVLCDVERSTSPPEDPDLLWIEVAGVYSYGFEARDRGCVLHQGRFVERERTGSFFNRDETYRSCNFVSSVTMGGTKTASGLTVRGRGTSSSTSTCRVVLTNLEVVEP